MSDQDPTNDRVEADDVEGFGMPASTKRGIPTPRLPKNPLDVAPTRGITANLRRGGAQDDTV